VDESTRQLPLFLLSSCKCLAPRVTSQPSCVAKNATLLVCLMPVGADQALSLLLLSSSSYQILGS